MFSAQSDRLNKQTITNFQKKRVSLSDDIWDLGAHCSHIQISEDFAQDLTVSRTLNLKIHNIFRG